jgi:oligoribonuclease
MVRKATWGRAFFLCPSIRQLKALITQSGLTAACLESKHTTESVQDEVLNYIKKWVPQQRAALLAGNSVHADRIFLAKDMPKIVDWLHYRSLGCSSLRPFTD